MASIVPVLADRSLSFIVAFQFDIISERDGEVVGCGTMLVMLRYVLLLSMLPRALQTAVRLH